MAGERTRRTKIVCTLGPASTGDHQIRELIGAGMDVARINFSHGTRDEHARVIERVQRAAHSLAAPVAILQDLAGPKVRIGGLRAGSVELVQGGRLTLTSRAVPGDENEMSISYAGLADDVKPGDKLLVADGAITLEVSAVSGRDVVCRVAVGGSLTPHKGINVPSGLFRLPILREKDIEDLAYGIGLGVDFIGLSFVRTVADVRIAKEQIAARGNVPVIAKIETSAALTNFDEILAEADGVMIARGDLSIETPFARVPVVQKDLLRRTWHAAKPAITATQMLFSMVTATQPTRAEVADVANAVLDGTDAVMLSEETAIGHHPTRAVATMASIIREAEYAEPRRRAFEIDSDDGATSDDDALARGACELARRIGAACIVTVTTTGRTARLVARYRPHRPVFAATQDPAVHRRLALVRGVAPLLLPTTTAQDDRIDATRRKLAERGWSGRRAVLVSRDSIVVGDVG